MSENQHTTGGSKGSTPGEEANCEVEKRFEGAVHCRTFSAIAGKIEVGIPWVARWHDNPKLDENWWHDEQFWLYERLNLMGNSILYFADSQEDWIPFNISGVYSPAPCQMLQLERIDRLRKGRYVLSLSFAVLDSSPEVFIGTFWMIRFEKKNDGWQSGQTLEERREFTGLLREGRWGIEHRPPLLLAFVAAGEELLFGKSGHEVEPIRLRGNGTTLPSLPICGEE